MRKEYDEVARKKHMSQKQRVLRLLQKYRAGFSCWQFRDCGIMNYNARVCELRNDGYAIENVSFGYKKDKFGNSANVTKFILHTK